MGFWHGFEPGQATWSDRILAAIMEKQERGAPSPHDPPRMKKDVDEFPPLDEGTARGHAAWLDWPWKLHRIDGATFELHDLSEDPMETRDRSGDPDQLPRLGRMTSALDAWMRSVIRSHNGADYRRP